MPGVIEWVGAMSSDQQSKRLALVVGNANYQSAARLKNPISDAKAITAKLGELGFTVRTELDVDGEQFQRIVGEFCGELARAGDGSKSEVALFYFAGHGVQVRGENYLLPVDGDIKTEVDLKLRTVHLNVVMEAMGSAAATSIIMLDCCRNNPLPRLAAADGKTRSIGGEHGLASLDVPSGAFVAFATQPDNVAEDGDGENSPFAQALFEHIGDPDTSISDMMINVRRTVHVRTGGRQIPWDRSALFEPFAFRRRNPSAPIHSMSPEEAERAREEEYWKLISQTANPELLRSFVLQFPTSTHKRQAIELVDKLRARRVYRTLATSAATLVGLLLVILLGVTTFYYSKLTNFGDADNLLDDADFVGGDIALSPGGYGTSMFACRLRCIFNRECTALSFDPGKGVCYLKNDVYFFVRPSKIPGSDPSNSEYLGGAGRRVPKEATFKLYWDRTFIGEAVPPAKVLADAAFNDKLRTDKRTQKQYWFVRGAACQQRCDALGRDCKGFSYTPFGNRCQLFQSVRGIAREDGGPEIHTPTVRSGCTAPAQECPKGADI